MQKRSLRWSEGTCVLECPDLVDAAMDRRVEFEALFVDQASSHDARTTALVERAEAAGVRVFALEPGVLERVADARTPQPVLAAVRMPRPRLDDVENTGVVVVLQDVKDPGNAGTIIRSADAAGASGVVFTGQSVDPFNPKTLRATAGSVFHLPIVVADLDEVVRHAHDTGALVVASVVRGGVDHRHYDFTRPTVLLVGNEADGLSDEVVAQCDASVSITMAGASESLNAGVAASLLVFEALWRRQDTNGPAAPRSLEGL